MDIINSPHDKFVKEMFGNVSMAQDFMQHYLPKEILGIIQLETIAPLKDSFITKDLKEYFSDLIFRASINGEEGYVCFLFEHKSYLEKDISLQLLTYMVEIWKVKLNKEAADELPMIIPMVIYHGKQKWNIEKTLGDLIVGYYDQPTSIQKYIPNYEYLLYDLMDFSDEEFKGGNELRLFLETLKYIFAANVEHTIIVIEKALIDVLEERLQAAFVHTLITYILNARDDFPMDEVRERLTMEGRKIFMSVADQLREKGRAEGKMEVAKRLIVKGFSTEDIMELTGLEKEVIENIKQKMVE